MICFVDGGLTDVARAAARQLLLSSPHNGQTITHFTCYRDFEDAEAGVSSGRVVEALPGRELIDTVKILQKSHANVVLDASGTSDQTIALAVALSDVSITPLCLDEPDYTAFAHAIDLVRIVSENLRRPEKHCVFLATRRSSVMAGTLVHVSGLLALKGLVTVPVAFCGWHEASGSTADRPQAYPSAFAQSVFDLADRQFMPLVRQRHFG